MQRLHYEIKGMSCAACQAHVERAVKSALKETDASFSVSLLTNSLSVIPVRDLDLAQTELLEKRLSAAISAAGYQLISSADTDPRSHSSQYKNNLIRLVVSAFFTLTVMYFAMGPMIGIPVPPFLTRSENALWMAILQLLLTLPVVILNFKFFKNGFSALFRFSPNMDSLIAIGSGASLVYGLFAIFAIATAKDHATVHSWMHDLYFESAAMILTLVSLGKMLESRAKDKASDAVRSLATLSPKYATVLRDGQEYSIAVSEVAVGDILLIRAGELIPVDGEVLQGEGSADESALTGESMPVEKSVGSHVCAACVLTSGALTVKATDVGENTSLSRIIRLLEDAAASKASIARIADRVSAVFVPCVMAISLITLILWLIFSKNVEMALRSAIAVLVISCPCALGLATPTAITVGIGRGARHGILFRDAESLEKLCNVKTVVFDKTGTVTEGRPMLTDLYAYGIDADELLQICASVERLSAHPLAQAITAYAEQKQISFRNVTDFEAQTGVGVRAKVGDFFCQIEKPSASFRAKMTQISITSPQNSAKSPSDPLGITRDDHTQIYADCLALEQMGKTAVVVSFDRKEVGILGISDPVRADSPTAIQALKDVGVQCMMLTGDNERTAAYVAQKANLDTFRAGLMPEDKERIVREISAGSPVAMVGDGINDAPALVRADVGIAIGAGTEVAVDSAGVVLSGSSLVGVVEAYHLSRATIRIIKENLFWALFYNAICIPLAAGLFYPLLSWQLSPMIASAAMSCSSVCVVLNALRLRSVRLMPKNVDHSTQPILSPNDQKGENEMLFSKTKTYVLSIEGMMCQHCVAHVKKALEGVKGTKEVTVSLENQNATVLSTAGAKALSDAVTEAGYTVLDVTE